MAHASEHVQGWGDDDDKRGTALRRCSRRALAVGACLAAGVALGGCADGGQGPRSGGTRKREPASIGRLSYRPDPGRPRPPEWRAGEFALESGLATGALGVAPGGEGPVRLVVVLHGAGGVPQRTLGLLRSYVDQHRLLLVAPKSRGRTWDVIGGSFGPDVLMLDELLGRLSSDYPVHGRTVAGFSDGASYALTLGLANGDVFDSVVAFSPGFTAARVHHGRPRFFVSHGTEDDVLPIDRCSRRLVPQLRAGDYDVTYREFDGGHEVPPSMRRTAMAWLAGGRAGRS